MAQKPEADWKALNRWFWENTAMSDLFRQVRDRMKSAADPTLDGLAYGIAR